VLACGAAAAVGYLAADVSSTVTGEHLAAFAAGGLLATLTDSLMPFSYEHGGELAGVGTVLGFFLSLISS
jgi:ZIP family zinc transporter